MGVRGWRAIVLTLLLTLGIVLAAGGVAIILGLAIGGFYPPLAIPFEAIGAVALLVPRAYPPGERRYVLAIVGTLFFGPIAVAWLSWLAVTRKRWTTLDASPQAA
jgi:hypothetical protein